METEFDFLAKEYLALWEDWGIDLGSSTQKDSIMEHLQKTSNKRKTSSPPKIKTLKDIQKWMGNCQRCRLSKGRNSIVFGDGNPEAKLLFVGEGPGADEDAMGLPFVGRAGKLLNKIIEAMGLKREDVYIANVVKCRPPNNRTPANDEAESCLPFLKAQIDIIAPEIVVTLGLPASTNLTGTVATMGALRGKFHPLHWNPDIRVMPTYHPAYLLRNPSAKAIVWDDMKLVMKAFGKTFH